MTNPELQYTEVEEVKLSKSPRRRYRALVIALIVVAALVGFFYSAYCYQYPYGWSHSCDKQLYFALEQYARDHGDDFPAGEPTPEACLSLLHRKPYEINGWVLSGKTVDPEVAERILASGHLLGPDTCSWNYVPGLSLSDDRNLALFWDKVPGLGHNGQRQEGEGFLVWFVGGDRRYISGEEWEAFMTEQKALLQSKENAD